MIRKCLKKIEEEQNTHNTLREPFENMYRCVPALTCYIADLPE